MAKQRYTAIFHHTNTAQKEAEITDVSSKGAGRILEQMDDPDTSVIVAVSKKFKQMLYIQKNAISHISFKETTPNLIKDFDKKEE